MLLIIWKFQKMTMQQIYNYFCQFIIIQVFQSFQFNQLSKYPMEQDQYQHQSECEDYADYGTDGYHPVVLGEKFNQKYIVIQKLGWGHFSTVWLVYNEVSKQYAALKIQRSKQSHAESALDQLQILSQIRKHQKDQGWLSFITTIEKSHPLLIKAKLCQPLLLLDNFPHYGIHGKHYCSVFEILGPNLLDVIQHYQFQNERMPLWLVKKITIDVLLGLVYLHEYCDIIHTDLKPQNIMIKLQPHQECQLIHQIKAYKVKPISMKFLKNLQASKNSKNKKKKLKKKKKKQGQKQEQAQNQIDEQSNQNTNNKNQEQCQQQSPQIQISSQSSQLPVSNKTQNQNLLKMQMEEEKLIENISISAEDTEQKQVKKQNQTEENKNNDKDKDMSVLKWKNVKIKLNYNIFFKIVDMGNACFSNKHFTEGIQTRQYRSPEVLIGHPYYHNTDIWSLACTVFELMTNNFLFKPKKIEGISKDEDHLFKMMEILGPISKQYAVGGTQSERLFNKKGKLTHGNPKEHISIKKLLIQDFQYKVQEAQQAQEFLLPMLQYDPKQRVSARQCLKHPWLWNN